MRRVAPDREDETQIEQKISSVRRLTELLDYDKKGFISKEDIYNTCYAIGLELSLEDMEQITEVEPNKHAEVFMGVLADFELSIDEVEALFNYFTRTRRQRRPDGFKYLPRGVYFIRRLLGLYTPVAAFFMDNLMPKLTPHEQSLFSITRNVIGGFDQLVLVLIYTSLFLTATGVSNISPMSIFAILSMNLPIGWGSQAARESFYWSTEGGVKKSLWQRRLMILRYTPIRLKDGTSINGLASLTRIFKACNTVHYLQIVLQASPLAFFNQEKNSISCRRRSSMGKAQENDLLEELKEAKLENRHVSRIQLDKKFNIIKLDFGKMIPLFVGVLLAALPTTVRVMKGGVASNHSGVDAAVEAMVALFVLLTVFFTVLVILKDANKELEFDRKWVECLLATIQPDDEPRKTVGVNAKFLEIRLDTSAAVEGFTALYKFLKAYTVHWNMQFHASSFVMLGTVCAASVIVIFIGSVLELEMDVWNTYLMATATIIWPIVLRGLFNVVKIDELLDVRLQRYLRHQRRLNEKILRLGEKHHSSEDAVKLRRVCEEINSLIEEIQDTHKTIKLLGKIPLNKTNMVRLAGAMAAGIFTTILRSAYDFDELKTT
ncbi:hypothetical protein TrCOL_g7833 [Triparma columacea]|uniref:EF-hand domain-containing protein n=1 Tax=Triparma columacea TaxID=722753 RepID=A0A9W7L6W3_9STRA|nr:hypothetical protein TrCOL_g7833 [Triparma columacea]